MCSNIPPEEFVETWMAYALSHLDGADPTVEYIGQFERKELKNYTSQNQPKKTLKTETTPTIYNRPDANVSSRGESSAMDVLDVYATTPKVRNFWMYLHVDFFFVQFVNVHLNIYIFQESNGI